jgi:sec-independent protein translocase protein TatC
MKQADVPDRRQLDPEGGVERADVQRIVLPVALSFLTDFGGDAFNTQLRAGEYFGFATTMLLASGLLFEVPIAMAALSRMGIMTARMYRTQWRLAIVVIAAIAAILPGGDPISMGLLMIPQVLLYGVGTVADEDRRVARSEHPAG